MTPVKVEPASPPNWIIRLFNVLLEKPAAALVVIFMLFIGMLTGWIPNKNDQDILRIQQQHTEMQLKIDAVALQIKTATEAAEKKGESDSKLLRGICFILAQQSNGSQQQTLLQYCN